MMDKTTIGKQIAAIRTRHRLTQTRLAYSLGIAMNTVSRWERGESLPSINALIALAHIFQTSLEYFTIDVSPGKHYPDVEMEISSLENAVYAASRMFFEHGEHKGLLVGNGHHMAQKLAKMASDLYREQMIEEQPNER